MRKCSACGQEMSGGADPRCPVTKANHKFDLVTHERASAERAGSPIEHPSVNWARGPHSD
jgi:hypothetical protein